MIEMNHAIGTHRLAIRENCGVLTHLARNFAAIGNEFVAARLREIAWDIERATSELGQVWFDELGAIVKANDVALKETLLAAFKATAP